jgi:hypothetical protein
MSRYLIEQLGTKSNVAVQPRSEVIAAHGDTHLTAIDIRDGTGTTHRHECGGLFVFIGADAETGWLPRDIARDNRGYVLTGDDVVKAGRWSHSRDPYLLESSCSRSFRLWRRAAQPGETRGLRGRRGQHGDRLRPQVSATGRTVVGSEAP